MEDVARPGRDTEEKTFRQADPLRERGTARDCCHNKRAGVVFTVATGIQLQSVVLTPTLWDTSKHQSVRGSGGGSSMCVACVCVCIKNLQNIVLFACVDLKLSL